MTPSQFTWSPAGVLRKEKRAVDRATVATMNIAASNAKMVVHRVFGTLSRSIHVAPLGYKGDADQSMAEAGISLQDDRAIVKWDNFGLSLFVGSWLDYSLVEELRGGSHEYMLPSFQSAVKEYPKILRKAMKREGLR